MKRFVALFFAVAVAQAKPSGVLDTHFLIPAVAPIATQYIAQDSAGQYTYGYSNPLSSKAEVRSLDGTTRGSYNYIDGEGKVQSVSYLADARTGFQLTGATNLPQAPAVPNPPALVAPTPVEDTPEVTEARARHLDAVKEAEARDSVEPAIVTTAVETALPALKVATPAISTLPVSARLVSYDYTIPGAAVTHSTYSVPLLAYNTLFGAPLLQPALPVPTLPALPLIPSFPSAVQQPTDPQIDAQNDSVTVEAKESKETSD